MATVPDAQSKKDVKDTSTQDNDFGQGKAWVDKLFDIFDDPRLTK
jgi:hypothetical protein